MTGNADCAGGGTCIVEADDFGFAEVFTAEPWEGWVFLGWKRGQGHVCGGRRGECELSLVGLDDNALIAQIVESDEIFFLEPEFVLGTPIDEAIAEIGDEILRGCLLGEIEHLERDEGRVIQYAEQLTFLECDGGAPDRIFLDGIEAFAGLEHLQLFNFAQSVTDIQPLANLTRLEFLELSRNEPEAFSDLGLLATLLADLEQLRQLSLGRNGITDLSPLTDVFTGLRKLRFLDLSDNAITDITPLSMLPQLHYLDLFGNTGLSDINAIAGLDKLRILRLGDTAVTDLAPLVALTKLRYLTIERAQVSDISALAGLTDMQQLEAQNNLIDDISALANLRGLHTLELAENNISDISVLAGLEELKDLDLSDNEISDISALAALDKLPSLELSGNRISDLSPLANATAYEELQLNNNLISDISPLAGISVEKLFLDDNQISDISSLRDATVEELTLGNNQVSDISPLADMPSIFYLDLSNNLIADIAAFREHYPAPGDPGVHIEVNLGWNRISTVDDEFQGIANGSVELSGNPLSCVEAEALVDDTGQPSFGYWPLPGDVPGIDLDCLE